jgi:hypothetical protein
MALFLQLDLQALPDELGDALGQGYLQFFYCVSRRNCCVNGDNWHSPFAPHQLLRRIDARRAQPAASLPQFAQMIPPRTIVGWKAIDDYPNSYELHELGFELDDDTTDMLFERELTAALKDKLLGWPAWVQCTDYPKCRVCGRPMWLIFSLESHQNLFYGFGDSGSGQITGCPDHPEVLAFSWQCL